MHYLHSLLSSERISICPLLPVLLQDPHELRPEHIVLEPASAIEQQRARLRHVQPNPPPCTNPPVYISPFSNAPVLAGTEAAGSPMPVPSHGYASRAASGRLRAAGAQRAASASMSPQSSGALADTLQQQRARLKPLQTSAKLLASKPPGMPARMCCDRSLWWSSFSKLDWSGV